MCICALVQTHAKQAWAYRNTAWQTKLYCVTLITFNMELSLTLAGQIVLIGKLVVSLHLQIVSFIICPVASLNSGLQFSRSPDSERQENVVSYSSMSMVKCNAFGLQDFFSCNNTVKEWSRWMPELYMHKLSSLFPYLHHVGCCWTDVEYSRI